MRSHDYEEFIAAFNAYGVRYLIVGAHALAFHARPRATKDLDLLVAREPENAENVLAAIRQFFGGAEMGYTAQDVLDPDWVIQLGIAPVRIDLLTELDGCPDFDDLWGRRVQATYGDVPANYIGLDLIRAKESADRPQDRADLVTLRRLKARLP